MAPYSGNALGTEEKQKLKLHEDLMAVLHGEILRCIKQMEAMGHKLEVETKTTEKLKNSIAVGVFFFVCMSTVTNFGLG